MMIARIVKMASGLKSQLTTHLTERVQKEGIARRGEYLCQRSVDVILQTHLTHPLENLIETGSERKRRRDQPRDPRMPGSTYHQEDLSCSTQCAINRKRKRADRIGSSRAFSYSSIGMTYRHNHDSANETRGCARPTHQSHPERKQRRIIRHRPIGVVETLQQPRSTA